MSKLLYQKYRATRFSEMVGNFKTVKELQFRAKERNLPQTILLSGNSGTGKTTLQRIISKALTCSNLSPEGEPCNECSYCKDINNEDFMLACYEYNGAEIGKQQVLEIQERAETVSLQSKCKIFFIDEFQGLFVNTDKALDTLLKIIEKPYKNTYFILGTMDLGAIQSHIKGKAIINRCSVYRMQDLELKEMGYALNDI
jgi:DNA polymerase-3 subunit gamma/tau